MDDLQIKTPETPAEFEAMWKLNHAVFAGELHQHPEHSDGLLIDKFHAKNHYRIAWDGAVVQGMICAHFKPPFSAAERFGSVIAPYIRTGKTAEIRLYAVRPEHRFSSLASRLAVPLLLELKEAGIDSLVISGVESRRRLYEHTGFSVVGNSVTDGSSAFYPMAAPLARVLEHCGQALRRYHS